MNLPFLILVLLIAKSNACLQVELHSTKLPYKMFVQSPMYDGDDTIYLMGGWAGIDGLPVQKKDIHKFKISTGKFETLEAQLPYEYTFGNTIQINNGSMLHFGGLFGIFNTYRDLVRIDQNPERIQWLPIMLPSNETYYLNPQLIGAEEKIIFFANEAYSFDLATLEFQMDSIDYFPTSATTTLIGDTIYMTSIQEFIKLFPLQALRSGRFSDHLKQKQHVRQRDLNLVNGFTTYNVAEKRKGFVVVDLPVNATPIITGSDELGNLWTLDLHISYDGGQNDFHFGDFVHRYNTINGTLESFEVEGMRNVPVDGASAVYVPKVNRIYIFGGMVLNPTEDVRISNEIWTIDLP